MNTNSNTDLPLAQPIARLDDVFINPITQSGMIKYFPTNPEQLEPLNQMNVGLNGIITQHITEFRDRYKNDRYNKLLGPPISWGITRKELWAALKSDKKYRDLALEIVTYLHPDVYKSVDNQEFFE